MTTEPLATPAMRERIARLRAAVDAAPGAVAARPGRPRDGPRDERPAHPRDRIVVRRDRDRPHRGRPADPRATSSRARSPSTRRPAGSCPEVAARAHLRWIVPVLDEAWTDAGVGLGRRRGGRGHVRARAGRLAPRRDQLRQGARVGPRPAARRGQPPRGPRLRRLAARPGRGGRARTRSSRSSRWSCRAATRSSSRCATT